MHFATPLLTILQLLQLQTSAHWYHEIHENMTEFDNLVKQPTLGPPRKINLGYYRYFNALIILRCERNKPYTIFKARAYQLLRFRNGTTREQLIGTTQAGRSSHIEDPLKVYQNIPEHAIHIEGRMLITFDEEHVEIPSDLYIGYVKVCLCDKKVERVVGRVHIPIAYIFKNAELAKVKRFEKWDNACVISE